MLHTLRHLPKRILKLCWCKYKGLLGHRAYRAHHPCHRLSQSIDHQAIMVVDPDFVRILNTISIMAVATPLSIQNEINLPHPSRELQEHSVASCCVMRNQKDRPVTMCLKAAPVAHPALASFHVRLKFLRLLLLGILIFL